MLPIFHPTTTILVDDVKSYLESVVLAAPVDLPFLTFDNPEEAIPHIVERNQVDQKRFAELVQVKGDTDTLVIENTPVQELIVRFYTSSLPKQVESLQRFNEISVIVADYAMPTMNGIEFFRKLGRIPQKRILLTGQADESIAVKAFNDGIIDQFITKGKPGVVRSLFDLVRRYQKDYFRHQYSFLRNAYQTEKDSLFASHDFEDLIAHLYESEGFLEHYFVNFPDGALLIDEDGRRRRLVALSEGDMDATVAEAIGYNAPGEFIDALKNREVVPNDSYGNGYTGDYTFWNEMVLPAKRFAGAAGTMYYALFDVRGEINLDKAKFFRDFPGRKLV